MPRCRVYTLPDGSKRAVHPAPQGRYPDEPETAWYARVMARAEAATPELRGCPFEDLDTADWLARRPRRDPTAGRA